MSTRLTRVIGRTLIPETGGVGVAVAVSGAVGPRVGVADGLAVGVTVPDAVASPSTASPLFKIVNARVNVTTLT